MSFKHLHWYVADFVGRNNARDLGATKWMTRMAVRAVGKGT